MIVANDPLLPLSIDQQLLDSVVKLTSQRDQESLGQVLVDTVSWLINASIVSVYSLGGELGHLSAKVVASSNPYELSGSHIKPLDTRPELCECIEKKQPVLIEIDNGQRAIFPVMEQGNVSGLLLCENLPNEFSQQDELILALLNIYANQQSLLNHQQRDGLTGLYNRVALQNWLGKVLGTDSSADRRSGDEKPVGCFAIFDIDLFKRINDTKGHLYGDEVLLIFSDLMRESFRFNDLLFRYGGEEFVAILNDTDLETALTVLERFRTTISQHNFAQLNQVTVTIGVSQILPHMQPGKLIDRADKALYYGKNHGRNQVNAYEWLEQGNIVPSLDDHPQSFKLF
ncbi:GGDEF domain-containing protein [Kaarinaea lacus]